MNHQPKIAFSSKYCKSYSHPKCIGRWSGLGFTVICDCSCHDDQFGNGEKGQHDLRISNTSVFNSKVTANDDKKISKLGELKNDKNLLTKSFLGSNQQVSFVRGKERP